MTTGRMTKARGRTRRALLALVLSVTAGAGTLSAQQATPPAAPDSARPSAPFEVGRRVRVLAPVLGFEKVVGVVDSLREGVVVLDTVARGETGLFGGGPTLVERYRRVAIKVTDVRSVEVSTGRRKLPAVLRYAGIGFVVGAVLGGVFNSPQFNPTWRDFRNGMIPGMIIGTVGGGTYGWYRGRERWARVPGPYVIEPRGPDRRTD